MSTVDIIPLLKQIALFSRLADHDLEVLAQQARIVDSKRNDILVRPGSVCDGFYIVVSGVVTLSLLSPTGESRVIEIIHSGRSFAEALLFMNLPSPVQAQVTQPGKLLFIPKKPVFTLIEESRGFTLAMLAGLSIRLHRLISDIETSSLHRSHQRVIGYLLSEADTSMDEGNHTRLELPATKKVVASKLGISAETFSRILHELIEEGLIKVKGKNIELVDHDALMNYQHSEH